MDIYFLYATEMKGNASFRFIPHQRDKRVKRVNIFRTQKEAQSYAILVEKILGVDVSVDKCPFAKYMRDYGEERQYYPEWLKTALMDEFLSLKEEDSTYSIRRFARENGIHYYTFRDWYRDLKFESLLTDTKANNQEENK